MRVFYQGLQTREDNENHEGPARVFVIPGKTRATSLWNSFSNVYYIIRKGFEDNSVLVWFIHAYFEFIIKKCDNKRLFVCAVYYLVS